MKHFALALLAVLALSGWTRPAGAAPTPPNGGWDAVWSSDATLLAYTSGPRHGIPNLYVQRAAGSDLRVLTLAGAHAPRWVPGTHTLVFGTLRTGKPQYLSIAADGAPGSETLYPALPGEALDPAWSADGTRIAFTRPSADGAACDLAIVPTAGGPVAPLTKNFWVREWAWSPDGATLAFTVGRSAGSSLWTVDLATKEMRLRYNGYCTAPTFAPNGQRLVIGVPDVHSGFHPQVIDLAAKKALPPTIVRSCNGQKFLWSPDGTRLYFCASRKSEAAIWGVNVDGSHLQRVTPAGTPAAEPALAPNGKLFAFQAQPAAAYSPDIYTIAPDGSALHAWTHSAPSAWSPSWSPNGKYLLYQTDRRHLDELVIAAVGVWKPRALTTLLSGDPAEVSWFPDGKRILIQDGGHLAVCDTLAAKDALRPLTTLTGPAHSPRVTGDEILFADWSLPDPAVAVMRADGSGKRLLTHVPVHPAGPPAPKTPPAPPKTSAAPARVLLASLVWVQMADATPVVTATPTPAPPSDPHAGLGVMAPVPNVGDQDAPQIVDSTPVRAPDGARVAFIRNSQLWTIGHDGKGETQLTHLPLPKDTARTLQAPLWTPDGTTLLFLAISDTDGPLELQVWTSTLTPDSAKCIYREAVHSEYGVYYAFCTTPPLLLDAGHVLFTSLTEQGPRLAQLALDGTGLKPLLPAAAFPALDATGTRVAYLDLASGVEHVRVCNLTTGAVSRPVDLPL